MRHYEVVVGCTDGMKRTVVTVQENQQDAEAEAVCQIEYEGLHRTGLEVNQIISVRSLRKQVCA